MDTPVDDDVPPKVHVRWFQVEVPELLTIAPLVLNSTTSWRPLTREESDACEAAWLALPGPSKSRPMSPTESTRSGNSAAVVAESGTVPPEEEEWNIEREIANIGIPIEREQLFEVDVRRMRVRPVYWQPSGPELKVRRSVWMYDETKPLEESLSRKIDEAYLELKPWKSVYSEEVATATLFGDEALARLVQPLNETEYLIIFDAGGRSARIFTKAAITQRLGSVFGFRPKGSIYDGSNPGITTIYRGWDDAYLHSHPQAATDHPVSNDKESATVTNESIPLPVGDGVNAPGPTVGGTMTPPGAPPTRSRSRTESRSHKRGRSKSVIRDDDDDKEDEDAITDLILIVHGIGQALTAQYESFNFVYATNMFRNVVRKQSYSPALASIMRDRRVQFLPVQWRASMKFDLDAEAVGQGHENHYTLSEITPKNSIPFIREMTNNVLTDIPLFMSHHRERMIESVCIQANQTYRLWCARNPKFEKHGRVHIIAHSLGSALVGHILSSQPTIVPPISESFATASLEEREKLMKTGFLFNTSALFNVGSPLSIFLRIQESQLIARKGRDRTMRSPPDEALDRVGLLGCMAVDTIYNIFNPTDPIAYLLNPTVDSTRARELPPTAIPNVTATVLAPIRSRLGKFWDGISSPFGGVEHGKPRRHSSSAHMSNLSAGAALLHGGGFGMMASEHETSGRGTEMPSMNRTTTGGGIEMFDSGSDTKGLEGSKAERRFLALNPHGTLDYCLPTEGNISEYVDMLTAHFSYWYNPNLASFILAEIFATKVDLLRTSIGTSAL